MLGLTLTNHLSVSDHVRDVLCRCGQSLYAIKVLRCHGMNEEELRLVYKSVVLAWWGLPQPQTKNALKHSASSQHVVDLMRSAWGSADQLVCMYR